MKKLHLFLFGLALMTWPFMIGHASYPRYSGYVNMGVVTLHILAVGIWMGGLLALLWKPKQQSLEKWFKSAGPAFSKWAFISVGIIAFTGIWMTMAFLPSFTMESLVGSEWGVSLLVKIALFLLLILMGYFQRRAVKRFSSKVTCSFFRRTRTEIIYGVIVFFFAATLVTANPSAAEQGVYRATIAEQKIDLNVQVAPLEMGLNTITLDFQNHPEVQEVKVNLSMPPDWRIENKAFQVEEGLYKLTGNLLHAAGTVNMKIKVLMRNGEEIELSYRIVVPGEVRFNE